MAMKEIANGEVEKTEVTKASNWRAWAVGGAIAGGVLGGIATTGQIEVDDRRSVDTAQQKLDAAEGTLNQVIFTYEMTTTAECNTFLARFDNTDDRRAEAKAVYRYTYNVDGFNVCGDPEEADYSIDSRFQVQVAQVAAEEARESLYEAQANAEGLSDDGVGIAVGTVIFSLGVGSTLGAAAGGALGQLDRRPQD